MPETLEIKLGGKGNHVTIVDAVDAWALRYRWISDSKGYVSRWRNRRRIRLHRQILGEACVGLDVDHVDGNPLNNHRSNLRAVTRSQNMQNRHDLQRNNTTGFRGVGRLRSGGYRAYATFSGKRFYAGLYPTAAEAAVAAEALRKRLGFLTNKPVGHHD
ncbi:MAG: HNH endonuclease [Planctomycetes bacterium]|nr:HNH endonuclease [Planctomycetota bacterium]